jgi:hypothetical protein
LHRQCAEFKKNDSKSLFQDGFFQAVSQLSRQVFSAQDGARQNLKIFPEPSGNQRSESVLKNSVHCF